MSINFINEAIFSFGEAMNIVKSPTSEEEYKKWVTPFDDKSITKTWAEVLTKKNSLKSEYDAQAYARNRAAEYPSQGDQNDMIYKDMLNSTTTHKDAVEAVKTKWPKNNSGPVE
jgi:hypothetical protein